jgi:hypothetical protein
MSDSPHREAFGARQTVTTLALEVRSAHSEATSGRTMDEVAELLRTLEQDNVRRLSITLLIDLLALEADRSRAAELVGEAAVLAEDFLFAGDYDGAREVICALGRHAADPRSPSCDAARLALEGLATTVAFREASETDGEIVGALVPARVPSAVRAARPS